MQLVKCENAWSAYIYIYFETLLFILLTHFMWVTWKMHNISTHIVSLEIELCLKNDCFVHYFHSNFCLTKIKKKSNWMCKMRFVEEKTNQKCEANETKTIYLFWSKIYLGISHLHWIHFEPLFALKTSKPNLSLFFSLFHDLFPKIFTWSFLNAFLDLYQVS